MNWKNKMVGVLLGTLNASSLTLIEWLGEVFQCLVMEFLSHSLMKFAIQRYVDNWRQFNGVFSRVNVLKYESCGILTDDKF